MKKFILLLVASCGLSSIGAAPTYAAPVEYVKVCSIYGAGWYYMPGTDKCVNPDTGLVKYQTANGTVVTTTATQAQVNQALAGVAIYRL